MSRANSYNVFRDFVGDDPDRVDSTYGMHDPYWVIVAFPYAELITYSRSALGSFKKDFDSIAKLRGQPMIITDDCVQLTINNTKTSYVKNMNASLKLTKINYLSEVYPGDWVMAWIVNGRSKYEELIQRIKNLEPCNKFTDGLKFVGRVHGVRAQVAVQGQSGIKTGNISLQATSFSELSSSFFYDPNLQAANDKSQLQWLAKIGVLSDLFAKQFKDENNASLFIPAIISIVLGKGVAKTVNPTIEDGGASIVPAAGGGAAPEAPAAYVVPAEVGKLLGAKSSLQKDYYTYSDILEVRIGTEEYEGNNSEEFNADSKFAGVLFSPTNLDKIDGNVIILKDPLKGKFYVPPTFSNRPVWQQLQQFLNPAVNEMFTSLRVGVNGDVTPGITARQIPFTTDAYIAPVGNPTVKVTKFLTVPRWKVPSVIAQSLDIGRSDATRINYVHVYGNAYAFANNDTVSKQLGVFSPVRDDLDIIRNGLRSYMTTVECNVTEIKEQHQGLWMSLIADWSMNSHLTLNGTMECYGITSPISEGHNLEYEGVVYHIEAVTHNCHIESQEGKKFFTTQLSLSNGLLDNEINESEKSVFPSYAGLTGIKIKSTPEPKFDEGSREEDNRQTARKADGNDKSDLKTGDNILLNRPQTTKVVK